MGRHSQGSAEGSPPPLPEPPGHHPYAPRSVEDTGVWDHSTYRVVDVGLPSGAVPAAPAGGSTAAFPLGGSGPGRDRTNARDTPTPGGGPGRDRTDAPDDPAPRGGPLRSVPEFGAPPSRYGAAQTGRREELRPPAAEPPAYGATRADLAEPSRPRVADTGHYAALRASAARADLAGPPPPSVASYPDHYAALRTGATRADLVDPDRYGARDAEPSRLVPRDPEPGRLHAPDPEPSRRGAGHAEPTRRGAGHAEPSRRAARDAEGGRGGRDGETRYGATRVDLAESVGATALAPLPDHEPTPDPDEVTDTGARRARSAFRLAPGTEEYEPDEDDYDEPSLLLQWGVFLAQTLTGAVAGLGVWLGFYRLWSTWPFYAAPAVGVATILMLVLARTLRRRHGRDMDLMTAIVTVGIATVLTVLPAAFTLQHLAQ